MPDKSGSVIDFDAIGKSVDTVDPDGTGPVDGGGGGNQGGTIEATVPAAGRAANSGGGDKPRNKGGRPRKYHKAKWKEPKREREEQPREQPRVEPVTYPGAAAKEAPLRKNIADLTGVLLVVHATLAALVNVREVEISEEEAQKLADASKEVLKHYPIGISEKALAWVNLAVVGGGIYGTRFMAYNVRKGAEKRARAASMTPPAGASPSSASPEQAPPPAPNGHAANFDLTPAFLTVPPEGEIVP